MAVQSSRSTSPLALSALPEGGDDLDLIEPGETEEQADHVHESHAAIKQRLIDWIDNPNIAREVDPAELAALGQLVVREYELDAQSRATWKDEAQKALDFAVQKGAPKQ